MDYQKASRAPIILRGCESLSCVGPGRNAPRSCPGPTLLGDRELTVRKANDMRRNGQMNWLGRMATAYMGRVAVKLIWMLFAVLRFEHSKRGRVIILRPRAPRGWEYSVPWTNSLGITQSRRQRICRAVAGICPNHSLGE